MDGNRYRAIGLMSGTSLDGEIDVALIETDGEVYVQALDFYAHPYDLSVREKVRRCFGKRAEDVETEEAEALVTELHIAAVQASGFEGDVIGFHGQSITHAPDEGFTWQLGDGGRLARETGIDTVADFRCADMAAGGQGAPLAPLYHRAIMAQQDKPLAVLNLGGVANVTYIGGDGELVAFDCGPANALMDDYIGEKLGVEYDVDGGFAAAGRVDEDIVAGFLAQNYFTKAPPKSLDRDVFAYLMAMLPSDPQDAMATLAACSVAAVAKAAEHFPAAAVRWYVCGGGRHNTHVMGLLGEALGAVQAIEAAGWNGDAVEAECFGYLAVRSLLGLPLSLPETTGVATPISGGVYHGHD